MDHDRVRGTGLTNCNASETSLLFPGYQQPWCVCAGGHGRARGVVRLSCVCACEQACECVCVCVSASLGLWDPVSPSSLRAAPWRAVAAPRLSSASFFVLFWLPLNTRLPSASLLSSLPFFPSLLLSLRGEECCTKSNKQVYSCKCNDPSPSRDLVNRVPSSVLCENSWYFSVPPPVL